MTEGATKGARAAGEWGDTIVGALHADTAPAINRQIQSALTEGHLESFVTGTVESLMHGVMLGALDSAYEVATDNAIDPPEFEKPKSLDSRRLAWEGVGPRGSFSSLPYADALKAFLEKRVVTRRVFDALNAKAQLRAFTVARMSSLAMIRTVQLELARQVARGADLRDFRKFAAARLEKAGWTPANKSHVECLPADALVSGAVILAAHRRWYQGPMVEVVTASGRKFSTTPNHPMLTRRGWLTTGALREGDDLIGYRGQQGLMPAGDQHVAAPPTSIAELFRACEKVGGLERIRSSDHDFHGDGRDGDVDIADPGRVLRHGFFSAITQPLGEFLFEPAHFARSRFCDKCGNLRLITERCGFCWTAELDICNAQDAPDRIVAGIELDRELIGALTGKVPPDDLLRRQVSAYARRLPAMREEVVSRLGLGASDSCALHDGVDGTGGYTHGEGGLGAAAAGQIEFDRTVSVRVFEFSGHVFNLSTPHGYFAISGLVTGNTIFRTNVQGAYTAGRVEHAMKPSVVRARPYWQVVTVNDGPPRQRASHQALHLRVLRADNPIWATKMMPWGYNCFLPGTSIRGSILGASRATYSGRAVQISTTRGRRLEVTANHPILTRRGLVPAKALRESDDLVVFDSVRGGEPAAVEDVFGAFQSRPIVAHLEEEFHGEARFFSGPVEVAGAYWQAGAPAAPEGVPFALEPYRIGAPAELDGFLTAEASGGLTQDAQLFTDLLRHGAGSTDRVSRVNDVAFDGPVYDFQTVNGWLFAGGVAASNCRCRMRTLPASYDGPVDTDLPGVPDSGFTSGVARLLG